MDLIWIGGAAAGLGAVVATLLWRRAPARSPQAPRPKAAAPRLPAGRATASGRAAPAPAGLAPAAAGAGSVPPALAAFVPRHLDDLPAERRAGYLQVFKDVPRPPRLMHHLLSPEFFQAAGSAQLVDLISAEPLIAAKVLATVNSSQYGLSRPVTGIGQAVTYLGLNTVRSLCVQHILRSTFLPDGADRKQLLETAWTASALASELAQRLSHELGLEDRGAGVSAVVLSFLGRLATVARTPLPILQAIPARDLLERTRAEQDKLDLPAVEIGRLLMTEWALPASLIADAADLDRLLVTPPAADARGTRLALGYLCARLGERLASGELTDLATLDLAADTSTELHHWRGVLAQRPLARVGELVRSRDLVTAIDRMRAALRA